MCFSAGASFGAGAVLTILGIASSKQALAPSQRLFASIPFIFGLQQISEGFVWLSLSHSAFAPIQQIATYIFLFFAQVVWPVWVPLAILKLKPKEKRRRPESILVGIGAIVSIYLAYCLATFHVEARILDYHISYIQDYPAAFSRYCGGLYIIATIAPPFFSRIKGMWMLGITIIISYAITTIFYADYIVSVWCFFASIISIAVYVIMHKLKASQSHISSQSDHKT